MLPTVHPTEICTDPLNFFCAGLYLGLFYGAVLRVGAVLQRHHHHHHHHHHRPSQAFCCFAVLNVMTGETWLQSNTIFWTLSVTT